MNRLLAKTIEEAYPPNNRPRGIEDIKLVKYHMKHNDSPIVIIKEKDREILVDGVHRLIASKLSNKRNIIVYVITI